MITTITAENFMEKVKESSVPVLVELWAPWCVHCRRISPVLDRLSEKFGDALPIAKINVDEEPALAEELSADVIPTLYLYNNGIKSPKLVAPSSQAQLEDWIKLQTER